MEQSARSIIVRPWQTTDNDGVWSVLKDGSYSNITATFIIILQKPLLWTINILLLCLGLANGVSPICLALCFLAEFGILYTMSILSAIIYLYGETLSDTQDIKTSYFTSPYHYFWVAECDGEIVGTIAILRKVSKLKGAPCNIDSVGDVSNKNKVAWLRRMAVKRKFRGLGIAKQLVQTSLEFCRSKDYDSVFLITTEVHHAARSLYAGVGFHLIACKPYRYLRGLVTIETFEFEMALK